MRLTPRVAGFRSEYPAGFKLECMAGFVGTRSLHSRVQVGTHLHVRIIASGAVCSYPANTARVSEERHICRSVTPALPK
jgi:hypothetical protein